MSGVIKCQPTDAHSKPTDASTSGYRRPIRLLQPRHRPPSASQLISGTFSHHASVLSQVRQWERGLTMLSPSGQRLKHTLRKLPKANPSSAANTVTRRRIMREIEYTFWRRGHCHARLRYQGLN